MHRCFYGPTENIRSIKVRRRWTLKFKSAGVHTETRNTCLYVFMEMVVGNLSWTLDTQQLNNSHFNYKSITPSAALFRLMDRGLLHFLLGSELIKTHTKRIKSAGWSMDSQQGVTQTHFLIGCLLCLDFSHLYTNSIPLKCLRTDKSILRYLVKKNQAYCNLSRSLSSHL